jgi:hypothetical protein
VITRARSVLSGLCWQRCNEMTIVGWHLWQKQRAVCSNKQRTKQIDVTCEFVIRNRFKSITFPHYVLHCLLELLNVLEMCLSL